ncbi:hypothetical protein ACIGPN_33895 [Streptomyces afghaniensis]|uniref:hypothetical protein n=1 Tax=Streptomyces TaxID=1883 RepID=UPI000FE1D88A|nr:MULTISPECIES: hypothetical protein [Streptomyces]UOB15244.1 hypothetical protein MQE23_42025 [Streptomyces sp. HP-A2021]
MSTHAGVRDGGQRRGGLRAGQWAGLRGGRWCGLVQRPRRLVAEGRLRVGLPGALVPTGLACRSRCDTLVGELREKSSGRGLS